MALSELEARLVKLVEGRRRALIDDLRLHVGLPTGGGNRDALAETRGLLTGRLARLGASTELVFGGERPEWLYGVRAGERVPETAVCRRAGAGSPALLSGHLDTVHDPNGDFRELAISADGKTATGPGCVDMKGGLVILVAALEALEEAGIRADWTVVLNCDEETGSYCSEAVLAGEARKVRDAGGVGLVVEPALPGGALAVERLGSGQFMVETRGRSAHVGRDFGSGVSAVTALAACLTRIAAISDASRGMIASVGPLEGGHAVNVVPERARAWGNVRFPSAPAGDELARRLDALGTGQDSLPRAIVRRSFNRAAKPRTEGTMRLAELARASAEDLGQSLPFGKTGGVCDGNILQGEGLATIDTLGVRGGGLHTREEWIEIASLVERCQLLALVIARIAQGAWARGS